MIPCDFCGSGMNFESEGRSSVCGGGARYVDSPQFRYYSPPVMKVGGGDCLRHMQHAPAPAPGSADKIGRFSLDIDQLNRKKHIDRPATAEMVEKSHIRRVSPPKSKEIKNDGIPGRLHTHVPKSRNLFDPESLPPPKKEGISRVAGVNVTQQSTKVVDDSAHKSHVRDTNEHKWDGAQPHIPVNFRGDRPVEPSAVKNRFGSMDYALSEPLHRPRSSVLAVPTKKHVDFGEVHEKTAEEKSGVERPHKVRCELSSKSSGNLLEHSDSLPSSPRITKVQSPSYKSSYNLLVPTEQASSMNHRRHYQPSQSSGNAEGQSACDVYLCNPMARSLRK